MSCFVIAAAIGLRRPYSYIRFLVHLIRVKVNYFRVLRRIRQDAGCRKIRILFLVHNSSKWKAQSLYESLAADDRYEPLMAVTCFKDKEDGGASGEKNLNEVINFFEGFGNKCVKAYDLEREEGVDLAIYKPDVVFYQESWLVHPIHNLERVSRFALCCYIPYSVEFVEIKVPSDRFDIMNVENIHYMPYFQLLMFLNFTWSPQYAKYYREKRHWWEFAGSVVGLGHPIMDLYRVSEANRCCVIYAPHFTIEHGEHTALLKLATFKENGHLILDYAKRHPEFDWVFKPHPTMRKWFVECGYMTADELDKYFDEWSKCGSVCTDGSYPQLFNRSKAMITDSGSFLMEYVATGRPLIRPVPQNLNFFPSPAAREVIDSLYETHNNEELLSTLKLILEEGRDPRKDQRMNAARKVGLLGGHAAENIVGYFNKLFGC